MRGHRLETGGFSQEADAKARTEGQTTSRHFGRLLLGAAVWALIAAGGAQAAVVTVGSPLTASFTTPYGDPSPETVANTALSEPGANVTSPVSGVIVRWRVTGAFHGTFKLRVLRPAVGGTYTGAGTSAPQTRSGTSTETFPTSLPIQAGDLIGVDSTDPGGGDNFGGATVTGSAIAVWTPPLADGATAAPGGPNSNVEFGFNADVATKPSNTFSFGKLRRNKNTGRAFLAVNVPGPGTLSLTGKGVRTQRTGRPDGAAASREVSGGTVWLRIAAKRGKKRKLENTGQVKVGANVTYTPVGDIVGDPNTRSKRVRLIKRD